MLTVGAAQAESQPGEILNSKNLNLLMLQLPRVPPWRPSPLGALHVAHEVRQRRVHGADLPAVHVAEERRQVAARHHLVAIVLRQPWVTVALNRRISLQAVNSKQHFVVS